MPEHLSALFTAPAAETRPDSIGVNARIETPRKSKSSGVEVRQLTPPAPGEDEVVIDDPARLYRPAPQLDGPVPFRVSFAEVTPEQARQWLYTADTDPDFRQRPTAPRDIDRWLNLMRTGRFVEYLPDGPLCFDESGLLLNGKHRLSALGQHDQPIGFMIVKSVPRWMFRFFDTGKGRTIADVLTIAGKHAGTFNKAQVSSTMRLAMRFEEFLHSKRPGIGWREWRKTRDEHYDIENFTSRRAPLLDWQQTGLQIYRGSKIVPASGQVFRWYQSLAWPDGDAEISAYTDGLTKGAMLAPQHPALVLREWAKDSFHQGERIEAKRELHLLLLLRFFALHVQGDRVKKVTWARGFPMAMPYHPAGHEQAVKNVRAALAELDAQ